MFRRVQQARDVFEFVNSPVYLIGDASNLTRDIGVDGPQRIDELVVQASRVSDEFGEVGMLPRLDEHRLGLSNVAVEPLADEPQRCRMSRCDPEDDRRNLVQVCASHGLPLAECARRTLRVDDDID